MQLGCHLSVGKGLSDMLRRGKKLGANAAQYFSKNPRSYRLKIFDSDALRAEAEAVHDLGMITVCHSPYVTNLSTPDLRLQEITISSIVNDLEIAEAYGTPFLVVHCGRHVGEGEAEGRRWMIAAVDEVATRYQGPVRLLLENTAGQGSELGRSTDELLAIHAGLSYPERVGFCFDTCHAFAAGLLDLDRWDEVVAELGREEFRSKVAVVHLNDSKAVLGAGKDRHALLGEGYIGARGLEQFLRADIFPNAPLIIETPVAEEEDYAYEIAKARHWASKQGWELRPGP